MQTILSDIVRFKKKEVKERIRQKTAEELSKSCTRPPRRSSLDAALRERGDINIIAEYKSKSPSVGIINEVSDVEYVTRGYVTSGAKALSVLTDGHFFGGSFDNLIKARKLNTCPILQKDFFIDEYQIYEAFYLGADAILLIASILTCTQVESMSKLCRDLGMESILEIHSKEEVDHVCSSIDIIGVNNRNLRTFEVSLSNSVEIAGYLSGSFPKIAESGIRKPEDVIKLSRAGYDGFLIGSSFMQSSDPVKSCSEFISAVKRIKNDH